MKGRTKDWKGGHTRDTRLDRQHETFTSTKLRPDHSCSRLPEETTLASKARSTIHGIIKCLM